MSRTTFQKPASATKNLHLPIKEIPPPAHTDSGKTIRLFHSLKRRVERRYEVLRLFGSDRETDSVRLYALIG